MLDLCCRPTTPRVCLLGSDHVSEDLCEHVLCGSPRRVPRATGQAAVPAVVEAPRSLPLLAHSDAALFAVIEAGQMLGVVSWAGGRLPARHEDLLSDRPGPDLVVYAR